MSYSFTEKKRIRKSFATRPSVLEVPSLLETQLRSYEAFLQADVKPESRKNVGLQSAFTSIFPITSHNGYARLKFLSYRLEQPEFDVAECQLRGLTYASALRARIQLEIFDRDAAKPGTVKEIRENEVYMGEIPLMTEKASFIVNGSERVIVSQLHRSPGIFFEHDKGKTHSSGKLLFSARVIPYRGSWLDFEFDPKDIVYFRVDRRRKMPGTILLKAIGLTPEEILARFYDFDTFRLNQKSANLHFTPQRLQGETAQFEIKDKEGNTIVAKDKRITARHVRLMEKAGIKEVAVPDDFLIVIDESHVSVPQIRAMYGGDRARKINLVEYGFRLPAAMDNRPLKFEEFQEMAKQVIYVSATPADYELIQSEGIVVEQVIRPTGLLDPVIEVRPSLNQIDDLMEEIQLRIEKEERVLVTTLTKRMAEELAEYLLNNNVRCNYIHSDVDTLERVKIMDDLRQGIYDVLIGVNLLREGLDLPEVSLVAILDADKEGFLRSHRSLTQTAGRAARNVNGKVIMYADRMTDSMKLTIDETNRRREKQLAYNEANGITPQQIKKARNLSVFGNAKEADELLKERHAYVEPSTPNIAADPVVQYMSKAQMEKSIERTRKLMQEAAKKLEFIEAAQYRDELLKLEDLMKEKWG